MRNLISRSLRGLARRLENTNVQENLANSEEDAKKKEKNFVSRLFSEQTARMDAQHRTQAAQAAELNKLRNELTSRQNAQHQTQASQAAELNKLRRDLTVRQDTLAETQRVLQKRLAFVESFFALKADTASHDSDPSEEPAPAILDEYKDQWFHPDYYCRHEIGEAEDKNRLLQKAIQLLEPASSILDVGPGNCFAMEAFAGKGHRPTGIGLDLDSYISKETRENLLLIEDDYLNHAFDAPFDAIWASHVLEHQPNPNAFIRKAYRDLKEGGWLFVLVPPMKAQIVGGHLNLYNNGLLLYQLVVGGFDCSRAMVIKYGYNVVVFVRKSSFEMPALRYDNGDLEKLAPYFPLPIAQNTNGLTLHTKWEW